MFGIQGLAMPWRDNRTWKGIGSPGPAKLALKILAHRALPYSLVFISGDNSLPGAGPLFKLF